MKILTLLLILFLAVIWDFSKDKIPNSLIIVGLIAGVINLIFYRDLVTFLIHIPGILFPIILLFPLYKIGTLGAGDIKLFTLLGFYFPLMETLYFIFVAFFIGAIISIFVLICRKNLKERIEYLFSYIRDYISLGYLHYYYKGEKNEEKKSTIHFSLPIFLSVLFYTLS